MSLQQLDAGIRRDRITIESAMQWHTTTDGRRIRVARFGSGPPLLCVPLVPEVQFVYMRQIEHLAERYSVYIYEPRLSRSRRVTVAERQSELESVVDSLGLGPVHLLAWSDAGSVAYRAARDRPGLFRSLALLGLADRYIFPAVIHAYAQLLYRRPIERAVPTAAAAALLAWFLGGPSFSRRWLFGETRRIERLPQYLRHSILPLMFEHDPDESGVRIPSAMVGGDHDALVPVERMRRMTLLLDPEAQFVLVPGGEHMLGYVAPEPVNQALDAFYSRLDAPSAWTGPLR